MLPCYGNINKLRVVGAAILLFTQYETTWLTTISSHCLTTLLAKDVRVQQLHAAKRLLP